MSEEKKIKELRVVLWGNPYVIMDSHQADMLAQYLHNEDYRKQREGEWKIKSEIYQMLDDVDEELYVECPFCGITFWVHYEFDDEKTFEYALEHYPYCNCGAKMEGGAE